MKTKVWRGITVILASFWSVFLFLNAYIYKTRLYESRFATVYVAAGFLAVFFYLWQIAVLVLPKREADSWNGWIRALFLRNVLESASWCFLAMSFMMYFMTETSFLRGALCFLCIIAVWGLSVLLTLLHLRNGSGREKRERLLEAVSGRLVEGVHYLADMTVERIVENEIRVCFNICLRRGILAMGLASASLICGICGLKCATAVFCGSCAVLALYFIKGMISYRMSVRRQRRKEVYLLSAAQLLGFYMTAVSLADTRILYFGPSDELYIAYCLFRVEMFEECMAYMDTISSDKYRDELDYLRLSCNVGLHRRDRGLALFAEFQDRVSGRRSKRDREYRLGLTFLSAVLWRRYDQAAVELKTFRPCITEEEATMYEAWINEQVI